MSNELYNYLLKHKRLPIFVKNEMRFYRAIPFDDSFYGVAIGEIMENNFRYNEGTGRYSTLFQSKTISYWADTEMIAKREMQAHSKTGKITDYLLFEAYDDAASTFPIRENSGLLKIVDGIDTNFLKKIDCDEKDLSKELKLLKEHIEAEHPDCLAYISARERKRKGYEWLNHDICYLFFDGSEKQLSLASVTLYRKIKDKYYRKRINCVLDSDLTPIEESYKCCFLPIAKIRENDSYSESKIYKEHKRMMQIGKENIAKEYRERNK